MRKGLSEAQVEAALGDLDRADLPAKTIAALRLADVLSAPQPTLDTATYQRLREHLDDRELLELGAALSVGSGWQRFIEAFGIRPDSWTEAMPLPWLGNDAGTRDLAEARVGYADNLQRARRQARPRHISPGQSCQQA